MSVTLVETRDGRTYYGMMKTYDHYGNIVLDRCVEKVECEGQFGEIYLGLVFLRGENIAYFGALEKPSSIQYQSNVQHVQRLDTTALGGAGVPSRKQPLDRIWALREKEAAERRHAEQLWSSYTDICGQAAAQNLPLRSAILNQHAGDEQAAHEYLVQVNRAHRLLAPRLLVEEF